MCTNRRQTCEFLTQADDTSEKRQRQNGVHLLTELQQQIRRCLLISPRTHVVLVCALTERSACVVILSSVTLLEQQVREMLKVRSAVQPQI